MLKQTAESYSKLVNADLEKKLQPVHQSVDKMLVRLEEFETMVTLVQQERCNAVGITGSLTETEDYFDEFKLLCDRIDALQKVVNDAHSNLDILEKKVEAAEKHLGIGDGTNKLKSFLAPIFKKNTEEPSTSAIALCEPFSADKYFYNTDGNQQS